VGGRWERATGVGDGFGDGDGVGGGRVGRDIVDEGGVHADVDVTTETVA
jgi:hypothetical protein